MFQGGDGGCFSAKLAVNHGPEPKTGLESGAGSHGQKDPKRLPTPRNITRNNYATVDVRMRKLITLISIPHKEKHNNVAGQAILIDLISGWQNQSKMLTMDVKLFIRYESNTAR